METEPVSGEHLIPEHMVMGVRLYLQYGVPPGGFLNALLTNNLVSSFAHADDVNLRCMKQWATWLYAHCPMNARGSQKIVDNWIKSHAEKRETSHRND